MPDFDTLRDEKFMRDAIALAQRRLHRTHPNPAVGAVVARGPTPIAQGFHQGPGSPHAEIIAIGHAGRRARGATLYTTLEPCDHQGRTGPCTQAIIAAGIRRVVYGARDPNPVVDGRGIRTLRRAGITVDRSTLRAATGDIIREFAKAMMTRLPFVTLKAAIGLDGKITFGNGASKWITNAASRRMGHALRSAADAVLVGATTVAIDNPALTARLPRARNPVRLVLDGRLRLSPQHALFARGGPRTILATSASARATARFAACGVEVWRFPNAARRVPLRALGERLVENGLFHLLVEGGAATYAHFLAQGLVDEVVLFVAPTVMGHRGLTWTGAYDGGLRLGPLSCAEVEGDVVLRARVRAQAASFATPSSRR